MMVNEEKLAKTKDAEEFMLSINYKGNRYISFVEITGQRLVSENKNLKDYLDTAKTKFKEWIFKGEIKPNDRLKFCFWSKGDFVKIENKTKELSIKCNISKYSNDRLHIEIPKEYKHLFKEGEKVKIINT